MDPVWFGFTVWVDIMYIFDMLLNFRTGVVTVSDAPEVSAQFESLPSVL
jgi:hypothetical protein